MAPLHAVLLPSVTRVKAFLDGLVAVESTEGERAHRAPRGHGGARLVLGLAVPAANTEGWHHPCCLLHPGNVPQGGGPARCHAGAARMAGDWCPWAGGSGGTWGDAATSLPGCATATVGEGPVPPALFHPLATIKEGYLHTRTAGGPALLPRFAFKKRYFWLSTEALTYSKSPEWQVGAACDPHPTPGA